ncbi:MAG: hypothetical protein V4543_08890 [Bacteroidota bacterium]
MENTLANVNSDWQATARRYVAYFDIMGFKDFVYKNNHETVVLQLKKIHDLREMFRNSVVGKRVKISVFSDSVLLVTSGDSELSALDIIFSCSALLSYCMSIQIPIKGAISCGEMTANFDDSIFCGKPLIEAYLLHEELYMYGCVLDSVAEMEIKNRFQSEKLNNMAKYLWFEDKVSFKSGLINHVTLNWFASKILSNNQHYALEEIENELDQFTNSIKSFYNSVSGAPRKYVDNTIDYAERAKSKTIRTLKEAGRIK